MSYGVTVVFRIVLLVVIFLAEVACHTNKSRPISGSAPLTSDRRAQASAQIQKRQHPSRRKSASTLRVALCGRVIKPDAVAIVVGNHESTEVQLDSRLSVERDTNKGWEPFAAQDITLRDSCDTQVEKCVALLPGAQLYPPPWQVAPGPSQCRLPVGVPAPGGRYRFRAKSCDGTSVVIGEPFQL